MNIESHVDGRFWEAIQANYDARNYSAALLDGFYFLGNLIREKSGLEGDGVALVGNAFGGNDPPLKVNKIQTESEKNVQKGIESILRGLYQAFRNPRSHEKMEDSQAQVDPILYFMNAMVQIIDQSKTAYSKTAILKRVFDPLFVAQDRYAKLVVQDIPGKYRVDIFIETFRKRDTGEIETLAVFLKNLFHELGEQDKSHIYEFISEQLMEAEDEKSLRIIIQLTPTQCWPFLKEAARLRLENKLIKSIKEGTYAKKTDKCLSGGFGTWITRLTPEILLVDQYLNTLGHLLVSPSSQQQDYAFKYFISDLPCFGNQRNFYLDNAIQKGLKDGDKRFYDALSWHLDDLFGEPVKEGDWAKPFEELYKNFVATKEVEDDMDEDIPF